MTTTTATTTFPLSTSDTVAATGATQGNVRTLLRVEALAMLAGSIAAYALLGGSWGWFAALFLVPDLSLLGYLAGARVGAIVYDVGHSYVGAAILAGIGVLATAPLALLAAAIWSAHISFDRALGYGLKYGTAFGATHLGTVGRR